jgi:hypothetical protein
LQGISSYGANDTQREHDHQKRLKVANGITVAARPKPSHTKPANRDGERKSYKLYRNSRRITTAFASE